jgi:hypothetical protein
MFGVFSQKLRVLFCVVSPQLLHSNNCIILAAVLIVHDSHHHNHVEISIAHHVSSYISSATKTFEREGGRCGLITSIQTTVY